MTKMFHHSDDQRVCRHGIHGFNALMLWLEIFVVECYDTAVRI